MTPRRKPIPPQPTPEQRRAADTARIRELVRKAWGK